MGGPLLEQIGNQFDDTPGGGAWDKNGAFVPGPANDELAELTDGDDEGVEEGSTAFVRQFDDTEGGGAADEAVDTARNLGPWWLDEATKIGIPILVGLVALFLLRPYVGLIEGVSN